MRARRLDADPALGSSWLLTFRRLAGFAAAWLILYSSVSFAQAPADGKGPAPLPPAPAADPYEPPQAPVSIKALPANLLLDQKGFWTTPFRMRASDWQWAVPLAFAGAGLLASDTALEQHAPTDLKTAERAVTLSNAGLAAMAGVGGGMFVLGHITHSDQQRETGLLSGEAAIDAFLDTQVFSSAFGRQRPFAGNGRGQFFQGGDSFPSQHAAMDWAIASVIAHEYPGPLTKLLAYGGAAGFSAARFAGRQHFPTDVIVGSALGWYIGRQVFRAHSHYRDPQISGWGMRRREIAETLRDPANMGSSYVALDSWVYPAIERLIALGYIQSADLGMRPWTRMECARLLGEAGESLQDDGNPDDEPQRIYGALTAEFSDESARLHGAENLGLNLDSIYTRVSDISGRPLSDGLHFGQTIVNDYGRPYGEGFNNVTGFVSHAEAGPLSFFVRGEYQHAAAAPGLPAQAAQVIQAVDGLPAAPGTLAAPSIGRFNLLEGYIGVQLNNWQFTFGRQSLWWGEDAGGPMLFSTNAAPILMLQINRVKPLHLPGPLSILGPIRADYIIGRLDGYHWLYSATSGFAGSWQQALNDQPFIVGQKLSLKPTPNLELGVAATTLFAGSGVAATPHKLLQAMFSRGNGLPGTASDAGDRRGGFDFAYRIPGLRDWLTFYGDAFTEDEINPWFAWNKAALTSGLYLSRVPGLPRLDFRVEGMYTDPPGGTAVTFHGLFYSNDRYRSGYTNDGNLIGSWIGREGQGAQAWTNYWFSPKSKLQFSFRHQKVSPDFIPQGGTLTDLGVSADCWLHSNLSLSASVQYERWLFPVIQPNVSHNVTASLQLAFAPGRLFRHSRSSATSPNQP